MPITQSRLSAILSIAETLRAELLIGASSLRSLANAGKAPQADLFALAATLEFAANQHSEVLALERQHIRLTARRNASERQRRRRAASGPSPE